MKNKEVNEEENKYGVVTDTLGNKIPIEDFVQSRYKDNRLITTINLNDGTYILGVENPSSTGRSTYQSMRLTEESYMGLISNAYLYFTAKGKDMKVLLESSAEGKEISYSFSDNLKPKKS